MSGRLVGLRRPSEAARNRKKSWDMFLDVAGWFVKLDVGEVGVFFYILLAVFALPRMVLGSCERSLTLLQLAHSPVGFKVMLGIVQVVSCCGAWGREGAGMSASRLPSLLLPCRRADRQPVTTVAKRKRTGKQTPPQRTVTKSPSATRSTN